MTSFTSIAKQLCINKIDLADDLLNEIKSYCFYDTKTWETMNFIKYKKDRICGLFRNATISRANPYDVYFGDESTEQQWVFWVFDEEDGPNKQFQCINCKYCGNYKVFGNDIIFHTDKIICYCTNDNESLPDLIPLNSDDEDEFDFHDDDDDSIGF